MKKTKKVLALLLTSVMMASALTACGDDEKTTEKATEATTEATTEAKSEETTEATTEATEAKSEEATDEVAEVNDVDTPSVVSENENEDGAEVDAAVDYSAGTTADAATVEAFAADIKSKVANKDWEGLADMVEYPVTVNGSQIETKEALISKFNEGVSDTFMNNIQNESCTGMMANGQGVMMGDGEVWFRDSLEGSGLVIITFNSL